MLKRIKYINKETKQVLTMSESSNQAWAAQNGYSVDLYDCEQAYNGDWYLAGFSPEQPAPTYIDLRVAAYPAISEQLDMMYHDIDAWRDKISEIKIKYPKE